MMKPNHSGHTETGIAEYNPEAWRTSKYLFLHLYDNMLTTCLYITLAFTWCIEPKVIPPKAVTEYSVSHPIGKILDFIAKYEAPNWPVLVAYMDRSGRYSIGYGTRSYAWETITPQEAYKRFYSIVSESSGIVQKDFPEASEETIIALTSLYFNCGGGYKRVKNEGLEVYLEKGFCSPPGYSGLVKRRSAERALIAYSQE